MLAKKFIKSLNHSQQQFIFAFNLSQKLLLISSLGVYESKPLQLGGRRVPAYTDVFTAALK